MSIQFFTSQRKASMALTFSIVQRDEQPVLSIRTTTGLRDLPDTLLNCLAKVGKFMTEQNLLPSGPAFAAYYNLDLHDSAVEIGFPVNQPVHGDGEVQARTIDRKSTRLNSSHQK